MAQWRFLDYVTAGGACPVADWYSAQDLDVQAALDYTLIQLKVVPDWLNPERKQFSMLQRKHLGLSELRFWTHETKYQAERSFRVAGIYRPETTEFVMLLGCEKWLRGLKYKPAGAFDQALKFKRELEAGRGTVRDHI